MQSREEFRTFDERRHAADEAGEINPLLRHEADRLGVAAGRAARALQADLPRDDPLQRQPDIALARAELAWEPRVQLAEGIARTVEWFRSIDPSEYPAPTPNVIQPEAQAR